MSKDPLKLALFIILTFSTSRISCLYNPIIVNSDILDSTEGTDAQNFMDKEINQNGDILENNNSTGDLSDDKYSPVTTTNITKDESDSLEDQNRNTTKLSPLPHHEDYQHHIIRRLKKLSNSTTTEPSIVSVKNMNAVNYTKTEIAQNLSTTSFPINIIDEEMSDNILEANNSTDLEEFDQSDNSTQNEYNPITPEYYENNEDFSATEETQTVNSTAAEIIQNTSTTTEFPQPNSDSDVITWTIALYRFTWNRDYWATLTGDGHTCRNVGNVDHYSIVKSVNTYNSCMHLYKGINCEGVFKVSKPGGNCDWDLSGCGMTNQVASVSSCSYRNTNSPLQFTTTESVRVLTTVEPPRYSRNWRLTLYQGVGNVNQTARARGNPNQDCQNIGSKKYLQVSSVNTHGNCVRLYDDFNCQGRFEESKPGSMCDWDLDGCQMTNKVASASSCHYSQSLRTTTTKTTFPKVSTTTTWTVTLFKSLWNKNEIKKISGSDHSCETLIGKVNSKDVASISASGDCIGLYLNDFCQGVFTKIKSDSDCYNKLGFCGFHDIRSISSCSYE